MCQALASIMTLVLVLGFAGTPPAYANQYVGCYQDNQNPRDLADLNTPNNWFSAGNMTIEFCISYCKNANLLYAGLQANDFCFCGNSFGKYGRMSSDSDCSSPCSGNTGEICGGQLMNSVYKTLHALAGQYVGCYTDVPSARDMQGLPSPYYLNDPSMTLEYCIGYCTNLNQRYAGTQAASYCFCGNTFGTHGIASASSCSQQCAGDATEICGGQNANSIYKTSQYVGCYQDSMPRDLSGLPYLNNWVNNPGMTIELCLEICAGLIFEYAGLQASSYCFCGNSYGAYGIASASSCSQPCVGNANEMCGGQNANSIYRIR